MLVGLGPTAYLEIIGLDPEHPADPGNGPPFGVADLTAPRLLTWAVHPPDPTGRSATPPAPVSISAHCGR